MKRSRRLWTWIRAGLFAALLAGMAACGIG